MAADYIIDQLEQDSMQANEISLMREAAIHVIRGKGRAAAIEHVRMMDTLRDEAAKRGEVFKDEDGFVEGYYDSKLNYPDSSGLGSRQISAIQQELCDMEGVLPS